MSLTDSPEAVAFIAQRLGSIKSKCDAAAKAVADKAAAAQRKISIMCVKGKQTKKVTAAKATCPTGYKKK